MFKCERCGEQLTMGDMSGTCLTGDFHCNICSKCRNNWVEHLRNCPERDEHHLAQLKADAATLRLKNNPTNENIEATQAAYLVEKEAKYKLYNVAKEWFTNPSKRKIINCEDCVHYLTMSDINSPCNACYNFNLFEKKE